MIDWTYSTNAYWRKTYELYGKDGFYTERHGKGIIGRPKSKE
jgi:transposase